MLAELGKTMDPVACVSYMSAMCARVSVRAGLLLFIIIFRFRFSSGTAVRFCPGAAPGRLFSGARGVTRGHDPLFTQQDSWIWMKEYIV